MKIFASTTAALLLVAGVSTVAFAEGGEGSFPPFPEHSVIYVTSGGQFFQRTVSDAEMAMMAKSGAVPVKAGVILMMHDGKVYMVQDHKMKDGAMLSSEMGLRAAAGR